MLGEWNPPFDKGVFGASDEHKRKFTALSVDGVGANASLARDDVGIVPYGSNRKSV